MFGWYYGWGWTPGWTQEHFQWQLIMVCVGLFLVSMVMSCQELRYLAWGKATDAQIVRDLVERDPGLDGRSRGPISSWRMRHLDNGMHRHIITPRGIGVPPM
ncbi:MAG: hypothetical protein FWD61_17900 [Phycisphaerales bacterium]|nr:hypothetical protein [Phycisphaerales bacterium]